LGERFARIGHKALSAGLIDAGWASLDHRAIDAALAECNGRGEPGWASSDY